MTSKNSGFTPQWLSPPGETIQDILDDFAWSQAEFADRVGYTKKHVNLLIKGKASISEDAAFRLEKVLGGTVEFWLSREAKYREAIARVAERESLVESIGWLRELPIKHMVDRGWMKSYSDKASQVAECLKFFGVASVDGWYAKYKNPVEIAAFKASKKFEKKLGAVAAWIRQGERIAASRECSSYSKRGFLGALSSIRELTNNVEPSEFVPLLINECAKVGVAVVLEPAPNGCPATGATKWNAADKALLMLSLRYKTNDHLWFAFFHEAAHILFHSKKIMFVESLGQMDDENEIEADTFASDFLIPSQFAETLPFVAHTKAAVTDFAAKIGVAPGIVVGRMQHDKLLPQSYLNGLKVRYEWKETSA